MQTSPFPLVLALATAAAQVVGAPVPGEPGGAPARPPIFAYRSFWPEFEAMGRFRAAGVDTFCIFAANTDNSLGKPYSKYPPVWRWFGRYDLGSLDRQYDDVLARVPDARFVCMIDLNTPIWLQRQLSLRGQSAECESFTMLSCACANRAWRDATGEYLEAVVRHMEARYGDRIVAYALACGQTDEWMDYSRGIAGRAKARAWADWRRREGLPEAPVPAPERLDRASFGDLIRDPASERDVIDYARFTGELVADTALGFVSRTRALVPRARQIGLFFGYILELTGSRLVWAGHLEYGRVMRSPEVDFLISPGTYGDRVMGGGSGFMVSDGTRLLEGKGFLHEIDHRTPTYNVHLDEYVSIAWMVPWKSQAEVEAGLKREFALAIVRGASLWCFDMWGGVFDPPATMDLVARAKRLWDRHAEARPVSRAEVALVVDPASARLINDLHPDVPRIYQGTRNALNRLGAPFDTLGFDDLSRADLSRYRLLIFPALFELTPERMELLRRHALRDGRSVLLAHAPGISDGRTLDPARVERLTGSAFGVPGVNAVARDGWRAIYVARYEDLTPATLRRVAEEAGVRMYCADPVPVYASGRLVAVHVAEGGAKEIVLPDDCRGVRELFGGREFEVVRRRFVYPFATPDTALFEMVP